MSSTKNLCELVVAFRAQARTTETASGPLAPAPLAATSHPDVR